MRMRLLRLWRVERSVECFEDGFDSLHEERERERESILMWWFGAIVGFSGD
jgi:hypothetical protein